MQTLDDVVIIGMLRSYISATLAGAGALAGVPCQIQGVVDTEDGTQTMTFLWEDNDGESHTDEIKLPSAIYNFVLLQNGQLMAYDSESQKWVNKDIDDELSNSSENVVQNKAVTAGLATKVDKIEGKGLSKNDFTDELKQKVLDSVSVISVNGVEQTVEDGVVDLDVATNLITEAQWTQIQSILQ